MKLAEGVFISVKCKIRRSSACVKYRKRRGSSIRTASSSPRARAPRNKSKTCVVYRADEKTSSKLDWAWRTNIKALIRLENRPSAFHELCVAYYLCEWLARRNEGSPTSSEAASSSARW